MNSTFTFAFLVLVAGVLLALVLRFVQPELIYGLRQSLLQVQTNKAFLDYEAGRLGVSSKFQRLLIKDFRYEVLGFEEEYVFQRINKIRELYRTLDLRRPLSDENLTKDQQPQVCIIELAALLGSLGRQVVPKSEYNQPTISGRGLLTYIVNEIRRSQGEGPLLDDEGVASWLMENPLSIEQTIEIMIAAAYGLALRQRSVSRDVPEKPVIRSVEDAFPVLIRFEKKLRFMVRFEYQTGYAVEHERRDAIKTALTEKVYSDCLRRMEDSRMGSRGLALDFFDFVYMGHLETLVFYKWEWFRPLFKEKAWLKQRVEKMVQVRNELAHGRSVIMSEVMLALGYCGEVEDRVNKWTKDNSLLPPRGT